MSLAHRVKEREPTDYSCISLSHSLSLAIAPFAFMLVIFPLSLSHALFTAVNMCFTLFKTIYCKQGRCNDKATPPSLPPPPSMLPPLPLPPYALSTILILPFYVVHKPHAITHFAEAKRVRRSIKCGKRKK